MLTYLHFIRSLKWQNHRATSEREYYKSVCERSRQSLEEAGLTASSELTAIDVSPCSHDLILHLSFDFAQQVLELLLSNFNHTIVGALSI